MGGFVVVVAAHRHPERFGTLLLLGRGVPPPFPTHTLRETGTAYWVLADGQC